MTSIIDRSLQISVLHLALFLLPAVVLAQTRSSLTSGDTLTPPNYITSPSGDFAFGLRNLDSNDSFLLAIWFRFDDTVVWFATNTSGSAVLATPHSVLSFTSAGQISLDNNLWSPYTDQIQNYGSLLVLRDDGNLQFIGADGTTIVWESFKYPTDTLLPGQLMPPGTSLRSRGTDGISLGRFSFNVQKDGNIVLYMADLPGGPGPGPANAYWSTSTCCDGNTTLFFDDVESAGHLYYVLTDGSKRNLTSPSQRSTLTRFYQHATLDPDGIFRIYVIPRNTAAATTTGNTTEWAIIDTFPGDGCKMKTNSLHGMCGPNSYCIYDNKQRLDCKCPSGYMFMDAQFRYKGCIPSFLQDDCEERSHSSEFKLVELTNTNWASSIYFQMHTSITEEQCSYLCLNSCLCAAALFDGNNCTEAAMLMGGWQTSDTPMRTLIKVRTKRPPLRILPYMIIAGLSVLLLVSTSILLVHYYIIRKRQKNTRKNHLSARVFTRKELHRATNGFSKLLGQGGFGKVYHGIVKSLQPHDVAVKELKSMDEYTETEFENEVKSIGQIHHKNLVRMIGYCKEGVHRMLVFEFMPRGSLDDLLFQSPSESRPPWSWRAGAAISIARGLEYLHYGCSTQIIHCDIKPDNILLDDKCDPKITDFGIARLIGDNKVKQTITHVRGTLGYLAPEWFIISSERKVDSKVDVFSFGVMLLEIICCRKYPDQLQDAPGGGGLQRDGSDEDDDGHNGVPVTLRAWVANLIREGNIERIVQGDREALQDLQRVERFARVALWCVQVDPAARPTMRSLVWMLEGTADVATLPSDAMVNLDFSAILDASKDTIHEYSHSNVE